MKYTCEIKEILTAKLLSLKYTGIWRRVDW